MNAVITEGKPVGKECFTFLVLAQDQLLSSLLSDLLSIFQEILNIRLVFHHK